MRNPVEACRALAGVSGSPASSVTTPGTFGTITTTAFGNAQRILQFAGKIQF